MKTIIKGIFACLYMSKTSKKHYDHTKPADRQKALSGFYKVEAERTDRRRFGAGSAGKDSGVAAGRVGRIFKQFLHNPFVLTN
jgi:hypothetical protein